MGLPEGWTQYGAEDETISAGNRYKALGNAIALPCAEYIMAGIYEALSNENKAVTSGHVGPKWKEAKK